MSENEGDVFLLLALKQGSLLPALKTEGGKETGVGVVGFAKTRVVIVGIASTSHWMLVLAEMRVSVVGAARMWPCIACSCKTEHRNSWHCKLIVKLSKLINNEKKWQVYLVHSPFPVSCLFKTPTGPLCGCLPPFVGVRYVGGDVA